MVNGNRHKGKRSGFNPIVLVNTQEAVAVSQQD